MSARNRKTINPGLTDFAVNSSLGLHVLHEARLIFQALVNIAMIDL